MPASRPLEERFWEKVAKAGADDCWLWKAGRNQYGYGLISHRLAHRVSWEIAYGKPVPPGLVVCHGCDNPACVNPEHLWLGTQRDNLQDMFAKGRGKHVVPRDNGRERNPMAKLTADDVGKIRSLAGTMTQRKLGERFGVGQDQISRILSGERWASGA
jgi:hypothetical protein